MKNLCTFMMAIVLVISATAFTWAQLPSNNSVETTLSQDDVYTIVSGDSLAALSPDKWRQLKAMNLYLDAPNRTQVRPDGWTKVLIYPGEQLKGLRALGIEVENAAGQTVAPSSSPSSTTTPKAQTGQTEQQGILSTIFWTIVGWFPWFLALLFAVALAIIGYLFWFSRNRGNAAAAGPKYAPNGISDRTAADEFLRQAQQSFGTGTALIESFRIENLRRRRASGTITVGYKDGTTQSRILENEIVYIADLHYPDGSIRRDEMLLSACGNPLRASGNVASYVPGLNFRFVDEQPQIVRIPEPEPDQTPTPTVAKPVTAESRDGVFFTEEGNVAKISLNGNAIEMVTDGNIYFSFERVEDANQISVFRDDVTMRIQNGRITEFGKKETQAVTKTPVADESKEEASMAESAANAS